MAASPAGLDIGDRAEVAFPGVSATFFSSWRIRWFWRWQAWRLRKVCGHETSHGVVLYDSVHALDQLGYFDEFCELHLQLMRESGALGADGPAGFSQRLRRELHGDCVMALLGAPDGRPAGYAWARSGSLSQALQHYQQVRALSHLSGDDWAVFERRARAGSARVLAIYGIGLSPRYRKGFAPLKQLLKPLFELGLRQGGACAIWWAPRASALHALSLGLGARTLLETPRVVGLMLPDIRPLARVFSALPASAIAALIARVAPPRPLLRPRAAPRQGSRQAAA
ncbi:MAG: hypothetical protein JNN30_14435 [Rhodanobacteraceae bacterium]|nr:hypothetical protein [Rhodanobacteraceae bacterium]